MTTRTSEPPDTTQTTPRFAALHEHAYRGYFIAVLFAMMADSIEHVISYWVLFQAFQSATLGGFAILSHCCRSCSSRCPWVPSRTATTAAGSSTSPRGSSCWRPSRGGCSCSRTRS